MIYDRKTTLGIKLRGAMTLNKLTRNELFSRLQLVRVVDPMVNAAYKEREMSVLKGQEDDSPHGHPWHVSFHASQFPGDDPMACPRQALYRMSDFPNAEPINRKVRVAGQIGKAIELDIVEAFERQGTLLSAGPREKIQTGFELPEAWLTCSVDLVMKPPTWNKPLPIEVKSAYKKEIDQMLTGKVGPRPNHARQAKVQVCFVRHEQEQGKIWANLDPVTHGYVFYFSRDDPSISAEFRVDYDRRFFETGIKRLKEWKKMFIDEDLPEVDPSKKHPMGWKWSYPPCQFCPFKKTCKLDFEQGVRKLNESVGIERAKLIRPQYDYTAARTRVFRRWEKKSAKS